MTVYVVQEQPGQDYSEAEKWGAVDFLAARDLTNVRHSLTNEETLKRVGHKLRVFDPQIDWVVPNSPYLSAAVFLLLGLRGEAYVPILRWDNRDRCYRPLHLELRRETIEKG